MVSLKLTETEFRHLGFSC